MDVPAKGKAATPAELRAGVRALRAAVEAIVRAAAGTNAELRIEPAGPHCPALDPAAYASVTLGGARLGYIALASREALALYA